jgi:hypothetical protein
MVRKKRSRFLTTAEAAEFLRLKKHTLENMRSQETGPPHRKHGGRVFYHLDDLIVGRKNLIEDIMRLADKRDGGLRAQVLR